MILQKGYYSNRDPSHIFTVRPPYLFSEMFLEFEIEYQGVKVFSDNMTFFLRSRYDDGKLTEWSTVLKSIQYNKDFMTLDTTKIGKPDYPLLILDLKKILAEQKK